MPTGNSITVSLDLISSIDITLYCVYTMSHWWYFFLLCIISLCFQDAWWTKRCLQYILGGINLQKKYEKYICVRKVKEIIYYFEICLHMKMTCCWSLRSSTHCSLVTPYGDIIWINTGSSNGLVPDGTKPLPEPMLTYQQWGSVVSSWQQFHG